MQGAQATWLPDRRRLHLHHGPIDMIVGVEGSGQAAAFERAVARFETLLGELVAELPRLRMPEGARPEGEAARRMTGAIAPFSPEFITPMAAVAGAGADTVLRALVNGPGVRKAYVNNGGDVAFHISHDQTMRAVIATAPPGRVTVRANDPVRGVATSGARGRSYSFGIADGVTVLADTAAQADAAATMIANAVDLPGHRSIERRPACALSPDSDLGARNVTRHVGVLSGDEIATALDAGGEYAERLRIRGVIHAAYLTLRGACRTVGAMPMIRQREIENA